MASLRKGGRRGRGLEVDFRGSLMKIPFVESDLPQSKQDEVLGEMEG